MKITKCTNSATNSCGIPAKPDTVVEESTHDRYLYLTKHGLGPGTLPKDVTLIDSKELSPYITAIWVDRYLTSRELDDYDIYPETMISEVLQKNGLDESAIYSATSTYDESAEQVNESYIAKLMESVDNNLDDTFVTYKYDLGDNQITCTSASPKEIAEYSVPIDDLSGELDEDVDYILGAIKDEESNTSTDELVEDGRYTFVDSKVVSDSDGFLTEYTMYYDTVEDRYVFVFGDSELYSPYDENFDWECETEDEAIEWFDSYVGPGDDNDVDYNDISW